MSADDNLTTPLAEVLPLLPDLPELESLRSALLAAAKGNPFRVPPAAEWYVTIEDRVLDIQAIEDALSESETELHQQVSALYTGYRRIFADKIAGNAEDAVSNIVRLGDAEFDLHRYDRARRFFETALALSVPLREPEPRIQALRRIGRVAHRAGDLPDALMYYERSARLAIDSGVAGEAVIALTGAGNVLTAKGSWELAEARYREAFGQLGGESGERSLQTAQLWHNLAVVRRVQGDFAAAESLLDRARDLLDVANHPESVAFNYHSRAEIRSRQGRFEEARQLCRKALAHPVSPHLRAIFGSDLAAYYVAEGQIEAARQAAREAEEHAIASRSPYALGSVYQELGNVHRADRDEEAWIFFERALDIARRYGFRKLEADILLDYALQRDMMDEHEEAHAYRERAAELFREMGAAADEERAIQALAAASTERRSP